MKKEIYDSMTDAKLSPFDFITLMFERTDEDGILYLPGLCYQRPGWEVDAPGSTDAGMSYRCKMDWNLAKYEKTLESFRALYAALERCAAHYDALEEESADVEAILSREDAAVFRAYLCEVDDGAFDWDKLADIYDRLNALEEVKYYAGKLANGEALNDYEKEFLNENIDVRVTDEERAYRRRGLDYLEAAAEARLGKGMCARRMMVNAWRLYRLLSLHAPKMIVDHEARQLAEAFVLHACGVSRELVEDGVRLRLEELEQMSEEELDELYRPQRVNSRKSLAPLFVYEILCKKSDSKHHLRQQDILKELAVYPYEISLERKALGRILHNLLDSSQYAVFSDKTGVWVDQEHGRETIVKQEG